MNRIPIQSCEPMPIDDPKFYEEDYDEEVDIDDRDLFDYFPDVSDAD